MRYLLSIALASALSAPALACINDTELRNHEREFRSQYQDSEYSPPQPEQISATQHYALGGAGVLLTLAAAALMLRFRNR